jgi:ADP-heptose:LPS heptosyltransferase
MDTRMPDLLVLFPGALGDFICLLPALAALRHDARLTVAAKPSLLELLPPDIDRFSIERREVADLFSDRAPHRETQALFSGFDRVLSWTGYGHKGFADRLRAVSGAEVAVHPFRGMREREHAAAYYARCSGVAVGKWSLSLPPAADDWATAWLHHVDDLANTLVIHPGSGSVVKNWTGFPELAERWRRHGPVIWIVGPADERVPIPSGAQVVRNEPLLRVAALLRHAARYVGNDSGISHLAGLAGARGLALFGSSDPIAWAPLGLHLLQGGTAGDACGNRFCTHRLSVDLTYATLRSLCASAG